MYNGNTSHYGGQQWPSGASGSQSGVYAPVELSNIEDGNWRYFKLNWNSSTQKLSVLFDKNADGDMDDAGELIYDEVEINLGSIFTSGTAYWGFTAATGGSINVQQVRDITYDVVNENQTGPQITLGTAELNSGGNNNNTTFAGVISGTGGSMVKTGTGTLTLSGANTYTSSTSVSAGTLKIANDTALGTTAGTTTVTAGATLEVAGSGSLSSAEQLTVNGAAATNGAVYFSETATLSGTVAMASASKINVASGKTGTMSGVISGSYALTKDAAGTLVMSADNTFAGTMTITAGTLSVTGSGSLGAGTPNNFASNIVNNSALIYSGSPTRRCPGNQRRRHHGGLRGRPQTLQRHRHDNRQRGTHPQRHWCGRWWLTLEHGRKQYLVGRGHPRREHPHQRRQ